MLPMRDNVWGVKVRLINWVSLDDIESEMIKNFWDFYYQFFDILLFCTSLTNCKSVKKSTLHKIVHRFWADGRNLAEFSPV